MKPTVLKECKKHGLCDHAKEARSERLYCKKCSVEAVQKRREKVKRMAVEYKGGKCHDCGLVSEWPQVYDFHHRDPSEKEFAFARNGHTRSWERNKAELDKCDMLCANCHRIRHAKENDGGIV